MALGLGALAYRDLAFWQPGWQGLRPVESWFFATSETTPQIVLAAVGIVLYGRRERLGEAMRAGRGSLLLGIPLLLAGVALFVWSRWVDAPQPLLLSLPLVALGCAGLLHGGLLVRRLVLPAGLLLLAVPLPAVLANEIVYALQLTTAEIVTTILNVFGVSALRDGDLIHLTDRSFEVIESCSGMRSLKILTLMALVWTGFFSPPWLHGALLVVSAPLLAFALNTLRVILLVLDPESEVAEVHFAQGVIVFVAGSFLLLMFDRLLLRWLRPRPPRPDPGEPSRVAGRRAGVAGVLLAAGLAGVSFAMPPPEVPARVFPPVQLPERIEDWQAEPEEIDRLFLGSVRFDRRSSFRYRRGTQSVAVFVGHDDRLRPGTSLISPRNALPGRGWEVERSQPVQIEGFPMEEVWLRLGPERALGVVGYRGACGLLCESGRVLLGMDGSQLHRPQGVRLIRLSTPLDGEAEEARARLQHFFALLRPWLLPEPGAQPAQAEGAPRR